MRATWQKVGLAMLLAWGLPAISTAQTYPISGEIHLSFEPNRLVKTRVVEPGEPFELYILVDIPITPGEPTMGVVGVEGAVALPDNIEFLGIVFDPPAINLGHNYREPGLETFVVGLGDCLPLGRLHSIGSMTLDLEKQDDDVIIGVTAPSVMASPVSSFAGIGPGWARRDCESASPLELVLFEAADPGASSVTLNPTAVPVSEAPFSALKSRYRD